MAPLKIKTFTMDNGLEISYCSTEDEARYIYAENFEQAQYLQHGIELKEGDTVIDVGANSGMFAILAAQIVGPKGRVLAFEPAPGVHECCIANVASHTAWAAGQGGHTKGVAPVEVLKQGCGDGSCDKLMMVVYDNLSAVNTIVPDHEDAVQILKAFIETQVAEQKPVGNQLLRILIGSLGRIINYPVCGPIIRWMIDKYARLMLLARREVTCDMVTLSDVIKERGIKKVALLKVDVERAELIVLKGMAPEDWKLVEQAAVEVHEENREAVMALLKDTAGFKNIHIEQADVVLGPGLWMIHATRK